MQICYLPKWADTFLSLHVNNVLVERKFLNKQYASFKQSHKYISSYLRVIYINNLIINILFYYINVM